MDNTNNKGNLRCWEVLSCRSLMLADEGIYPPFFKNNHNYISYKNSDDLLSTIESVLGNYDHFKTIADNGYQMIKTNYSKENQWKDFKKLCE